MVPISFVRIKSVISDTKLFILLVCFVFPKSFPILLCAVPIHLTLMSVQHPTPGSFTTGSTKGGTELPERRAMSVTQDKSAKDTQVQAWFLSSGFVCEKCLCLQVAALLVFVH